MIRLSKSCIGDLEKQAVIRVLDEEFLGMGKNVQEFEEILSTYFGRPVVCVSSGTAALHLSLQAAGLDDDDEVLVQSLTYIACFQAISATGARPISCDVNLKTLCIDLKDAEKKITSKTKAIMPVHYSGGVGDLDGVYSLAKKYNLRVIEDSAHAFGTFYNGKKIGSFGDIACFSFDGIKNITSGEGGCIVTDDSNVLKKIKDARLLGVESDTDKRYCNERSWGVSVSSQGWRYHMSNIMAAIGIEQFKSFPMFLEKRKELAKYYDELLSHHEKVITIKHNYQNVVPHIYVIRIMGMSNRNELQNKLLEKGIQTGYHYQPNHLLDMYKSDKEEVLFFTDRVFPELLTLPLHFDINKSDINYIVECLLEEI